MKKRVFIGSSSEASNIANDLKAELSKSFECCVWYEGFFTLGHHFYTDLVQKIISFDYAIMVGAEDDCVKRLSNGNEKTAPRDNIYLEYGLFSGFLSQKRVLLLIHKNCTPASDLNGMSLLQYSDNLDAISKACEWIKEVNNPIERSISRANIELLPTVGIAVGYYDNFVKRIVTKVLEQESHFMLKIYVPSFLTSNVDDYKTDLIMRLGLKDSFICNYRILVDSDTSDVLNLYDVPSTLTALFKTAEYIFGTSNSLNGDLSRAKIRALDNFCDNLRLLIDEDIITSKRVLLIRYEQE